jgi:hypothetical protein
MPAAWLLLPDIVCLCAAIMQRPPPAHRHVKNSAFCCSCTVHVVKFPELFVPSERSEQRHRGQGFSALGRRGASLCLMSAAFWDSAESADAFWESAFWPIQRLRLPALQQPSSYALSLVFLRRNADHAWHPLRIRERQPRVTCEGTGSECLWYHQSCRSRRSRCLRQCLAQNLQRAPSGESVSFLTIPECMEFNTRRPRARARAPRGAAAARALCCDAAAAVARCMLHALRDAATYAAGPHQLDSVVGAGTYIPRTASRPCRLTEGIVRAQRA